MRRRTVILLSSVGATGRISLLAGTLGSVEGVLISLILNSHLWVKGLVFIAVFTLGIYVSGLAERLSGLKDDHSVVIDEVIGAIAATFFLPQGIWPWVAALGIFRLIDWTKPFPIRRIEKWRGGAGIVADDVLAGLYSLGIIWVIYGCRTY